MLDEGCKMSPKGLNAAWRAAAKQHYGPWVDVALLNKLRSDRLSHVGGEAAFSIPALLGDLTCQASPFEDIPFALTCRAR
jgi:hypothetical protein